MRRRRIDGSSPNDESKSRFFASEDNKRKRNNAPRWFCLRSSLKSTAPLCARHRKRCAFVLYVSAFLLTVVILHEAFYFRILNEIDISPNIGARRNALGSPDKAYAAVVSLHRSNKFLGYLGQWLSDVKKKYAAANGYAYFDERSFPPETSSKLFQLSERQRVPRMKDICDKMRFLLYILDVYPELKYLLWIDGDSVISSPGIAIEDRMDLFHRVNAGNDDGDAADDLCMIWSEDHSRPNDGVMLLANTLTTRNLLKVSLEKYSEYDHDLDASSAWSPLISAVNNNSTYSSCVLLLSEDKQTRLLQSRARGEVGRLWKKGDWILHLPNHGRWELLQSLRKTLPVRSPNEQKACHALGSVKPPDLSALSGERRQRYEAVRDAIKHAWNAYASSALRSGSSTPGYVLRGAIPADDASPLSNSAHSWLNYGATLHDALDTLLLANLTVEYEEALSVVLATDIRTTSYQPTKTFEYSLRILGGLLGAFSLSGDERLLVEAKRAADSLLEGPFQSSPTVLPRPYDMLAPSAEYRLFSTTLSAILRRWYASVYRWGRDTFTKEHHFNSLAGVGSFGVEFSFLSAATGDEAYRSAANAIFRHVSRNRLKIDQEKGSVSTGWNVMTGDARYRSDELGSGADSFYEYLLKQPLLNGCTCGDNHGEDFLSAMPSSTCDESDRSMLSLYLTMVEKSMRPYHAVQGRDGISYPVDGNSFHHLLCFVPGMLGLGASELKENSNQTKLLAMRLLEGCYDAYKSSPSGLAPEMAQVVNGELWHRGEKVYLLRPEFVESVFVLYRITKDTKYQQMGWEVFQSIQKYCRTQRGYVGLKDVYNPSEGQVDDMPSYFLAETLKYLLLLFGPDDYVSLDEFVFTTEAHPLRRVQRFDTPLCYSRNSSTVPFPWLLAGGLVSAFVGISFLLYGVVWITLLVSRTRATKHKQ